MHDKKKQVRWKRKDDAKLFEYVENYCASTCSTIPSLINNLKTDSKDQEFWEKAAIELKWNRCSQSLVNRFLKLCLNQDLSTREEKLLRKLIRVKRRTQSSMRWIDIIKKFPGKRADTLINYAVDHNWIDSHEEIKLEQLLKTQNYNLIKD